MPLGDFEAEKMFEEENLHETEGGGAVIVGVR